ncbi:hypothetical protein BHM03_00051743 [Ensete ventricosum]|uniref:Clp R domain-containing protein n=1 Tax=Ensete ventricosum TaxID=4639 RepID=A0A445MLP1_ENSVE|nr:hypothetical protein BHM03_00051743 [Ensete ventricosum]
MEAACSSSCSPSLLTLHSLRPSSGHRRPVAAALYPTAAGLKASSSSSSLLVEFRRRSLTSIPLPPSQRYCHRRPPRRAISAVFERFTERAIKTVMFSQREAQAHGMGTVFNQHLLLGLVAEDKSPSGFLGSGITIDRAREAVRAIWPDGVAADHATAPSAGSSTGVPFSLNSKRVFQAAVECSKNMGCKFIAPEHITIGLLNADDGSAAQVLQSEDLIDPVIGRDTEIQRIVQILCRRTKNNPILLGDPGVGKTAIAEGLALRIARGEIPSFLKVCFSYTWTNAGDIILFVDEVHTLIGSGVVGKGNNSSGLDIANLLKPALGRGELQEDAVKILLGLREKYEIHHKCTFTLEAINAAVYLSARYIPDRHLPDKAIDLIDEAGSRAHMDAFKKKKEEQVSVLSKSPEEYWREIRAVQAMHEVQLNADERKLLVGLDEELRKRVIGQDDAVNAISRAVKRSRVGLKDPDRPIAAMLFCGPTGVGKTELTKSPLRRAVTQIIEDVISEAILAGDYKPGDTLTLDVDGTGNPVVNQLPDQSIHLSDATV